MRQKELEKYKHIHHQIQHRKSDGGQCDFSKISETIEEPAFQLKNDVVWEQQVEVKVHPLDFDDLNKKQVSDEQLLLSHFNAIIDEMEGRKNVQIDFSDDQEFQFVEQAKSLDLNVITS